MSAASPPPARPLLIADFIRLLGPLVLVVFLGFMTVGAPLPVLPLFVAGDLGFGAVVVGVAIGLQSAATILTRSPAGKVCDTQGPRRSVMFGAPLAVLAGLLYLAAAWLPVADVARLIVLLLGRVALGAAESLILTGTMTWAIVRVGQANAGRAMAWQGMAMYAAIGAGAPIGLWLADMAGFIAVAWLTVALGVAAFALALTIAPPPPLARPAHGSFLRVVRLIWAQGSVLMLATVAYGALIAFLTLHFAARNWGQAGLALALFAAGYIAVRLFLGHLPDRAGGGRVALLSLLIEAAGQMLLWLAPSEGLALAGAALSGIGYSLIFPCMGVEALRRVPPENRGLAMGGFIAFFDFAIALAGPATGLVVAGYGYGAVFGVGALACVVGVVLTVPMMRRG